MIPAAIIGHNILDIPTAINIISGSMRTIYGILDSVTKSNSTHLNELNSYLRRSDLRASLNVYTSLLHELGETNFETIAICIHDVQDAIKAIEMEMLMIGKNKKYNDSLYIAKSWRSYSFQQNIERLEQHVSVLEKRINNLKLCGELIIRRSAITRGISIKGKKLATQINDYYCMPYPNSI